MLVGRVLLISVMLLLALTPAAEAAGRRVPQGFFGAMYDRAVTRAPEADQDAQAAKMARSGVESARTVFSWADAQPDPAAAPNLTSTDALVARLSQRGIAILPVVINAPVWARRYPDRDGSPPRNPSDYAAYLRALIERYGPNGSLWAERPELPRRPLREWQIWNEPHLDGYWYVPRGSWAPGYVELLGAANAAVKRADPGAKVVLAGIADYVWAHLRKIYREGGDGLFDVVALNFYTSKVTNYPKALKRVRSVMRAAGDRRLPVWLTEVTWPAAKGRMRPGAAWHRAWLQTDRGMARRLTQTYALLVRGRRTHRLGRAYWYTWSSGYRRGDLFDFGGLLSLNGGISTARPALRAYRRSARRYEGCATSLMGCCR